MIGQPQDPPKAQKLPWILAALVALFIGGVLIVDGIRSGQGLDAAFFFGWVLICISPIIWWLKIRKPRI